MVCDDDKTIACGLPRGTVLRFTYLRGSQLNGWEKFRGGFIQFSNIAFMIDWLIIYGPLIYRDITSTGEGLLSAHNLWAGRDLYRTTPVWHEALLFPVSFEGPPHSVASYDTQRDVVNVFQPGSSRVPIQSPLTTQEDVEDLF
jgi:hypothetical protein